MKKECIEWSELFSFTDFLMNEKHKTLYATRGVYLFLLDGKVSYVGKTSQNGFYARMLDHYLLTVSGRYTIKRNDNDDWIPNWRKDHQVVETYCDLEKYQALVTDGFAQAEKYKICISEIKEQKDISALENQLIFDLQPDENTRGKRSFSHDAIEIEHVLKRSKNLDSLKEALNGQKVTII